MFKVLISAYTGLGNFIQKTPMIKKIRELYPECHIDILAGNNYGTEYVLKGSEFVDKIYFLKENSTIKEKISFYWQLRKKKYDAVFIAFDSMNLSLLWGSYLAGVKSRVLHINIQTELLKFLILKILPKNLLVPLLQGRHEIDLNYDLLEAYYNKPLSRSYETTINVTKKKEVLKKFSLEQAEYLIMQVGASNGFDSAKKWSLKNYEELIRKLNLIYKDLKIVLVGDKGDYETDICKLEKEDISFINTAGLTTLEEVTNLLYYSKLVIANDSGIMHIANALKRDLIALFGPTDYTRTRPLGEKSTILYSRTASYAIMYNFGATDKEILQKYSDCMSGIKVEQVFVEVQRILEN